MVKIVFPEITRLVSRAMGFWSLGISDMGEQSPVNLSMGFWSPRMPDMGEQSPVKSVRGCADTNKSDRGNINVLERREEKYFWCEFKGNIFTTHMIWYRVSKPFGTD